MKQSILKKTLVGFCVAIAIAVIAGIAAAPSYLTFADAAEEANGIAAETAEETSNPEADNVEESTDPTEASDEAEATDDVAVSSDATTESVVLETPHHNEKSMIEGGVVTEANVEALCVSCHLKTDVPNWNKNNITFGMVESMLPGLSDADIEAFVAYFANIEPVSEGE